MKQVSFILMCITVIYLISGCSSRSIQYIPVEITAPIVQCHSDKELEQLSYDKLNESFHVGTEYNQDIIQNNILKLKNAYKLLYASVICYKNQVEKSKELNEKQKVEFNKIKGQ